MIEKEGEDLTHVWPLLGCLCLHKHSAVAIHIEGQPYRGGGPTSLYKTWRLRPRQGGPAALKGAPCGVSDESLERLSRGATQT